MKGILLQKYLFRKNKNLFKYNKMPTSSKRGRSPSRARSPSRRSPSRAKSPSRRSPSRAKSPSRARSPSRRSSNEKVVKVKGVNYKVKKVNGRYVINVV
jgi:hypothetical protein